MTTTKLKVAYILNREAHEALALAGTPVSRLQNAEIEVDAAEALAHGLVTISPSGEITAPTRDERIRVPGGDVSKTAVDALAVWVPHLGSAILETDHVLTVEELASAYRGSRASRDAAVAVQDASQAESKRRDAERSAASAARDSVIAELLPRLRAGAGQIEDSPWPNWIEIDATRINLRADDDHADSLHIDALGQIALERRKQLEARVEAERDAWIAAHGSARLVKGLAAGVIASLETVYREERVAHDMGAEWIRWEAAPEPEDHDRINPSETEIDALVAARKRWPDSSLEICLCSVGGEDRRGESHPWRPALMMILPWDRKSRAIKYLDSNE